jgi:Na+-driven multidrug efflux pump
LNAAAYGDAAVAAMAIVAKVFMFLFSVILGVGQGYQPVLGYNYGARKFERVRSAFSFTFKFCLAAISACSAAVFLAAPAIMRVFIKGDPEVVRIGAFALRAQCLALPLIPMGMMSNMTFQSIGKSWTATFLSAARQGYWFLPLIIVLPRFLGLTGVQISQALADLLTFATCLPFILVFFAKLGKTAEGNRAAEPAPSVFSEE